MRNKNGYTIIDIVVLITLLGLITLVSLPKMSKAFYNNKEEAYQDSLELYLKQATKYGNTIKEQVKETDPYIITIQDLVDNGYVGALDGQVKDIRDGSSMLELKFRLIYDESSDSVSAQVV